MSRGRPSRTRQRGVVLQVRAPALTSSTHPTAPADYPVCRSQPSRATWWAGTNASTIGGTSSRDVMWKVEPWPEPALLPGRSFATPWFPETLHRLSVLSARPDSAGELRTCVG
jgi:hypothetical protein